MSCTSIFNQPKYLFSAHFCTSTSNFDKSPRKTTHRDNDSNSDVSTNHRLTHVDHHGNATMVDVSSKLISHRKAMASGRITLSPEAFKLVLDNQLSKKGSVLNVAQIAGLMAAKQTANLIPLCHNVPLTKVWLNFEPCDSDCTVTIYSSVECVGVTGVEMEALTAVSVALLTIYDMTKAVAKDHVISDIQLEEKEGGASGNFRRT